MTPETPAPSGISRRSLGRRRVLWRTTGAVYVIFALTMAIFALIPSLELSYERVLPLSLAAAAIGIAHLFTRPASMESTLTHLDLAAMAACLGLGVLAFAPTSIPVVTAAMFAGPLIAVRLIDRGQIAAHLLLVTAALAVPALLYPADPTTQRALLTLVPAMWAIALCVVVGLERLEAQGDALGRLARMDPLTGVANRQLLGEVLTSQVRSRAGRQQPVSILMLDLNGFRHLNETVGYAAGDRVLQDVATTLTTALPRHAFIARYGGDEFVVLLPAGPTAASEAAGTIHRSLAELTAGGVRVTTGIGIASAPDDSPHPGVLLQIADERLLADKGRTVRPANADPRQAGRA